MEDDVMKKLKFTLENNSIWKYQICCLRFSFKFLASLNAVYNLPDAAKRLMKGGARINANELNCRKMLNTQRDEMHLRRRRRQSARFCYRCRVVAI
jgi:hypothetical protein